MKVSIITTCYNRSSTIRGAIESVLKQDYPDIEYIIVDGASTDNSLNIIHEYKDKIEAIISEPDQGMYEALNKGIKRATGEIIGLVHSDDFLFSTNTITKIVNEFRTKQVDFVYGDGFFVNPKNIDKVVRIWKGGKYSKWKVRNGWLPLHPTCYMKRSLLEENGLYDENFKIAADTDLLLRLLLRQDIRIAYLKEYIIKMRMGGLSTSRERRKQMWKEDLQAYKKNGLPPLRSKLQKMAWKFPQLIKPFFINI